MSTDSPIASALLSRFGVTPVSGGAVSTEQLLVDFVDKVIDAKQYTTLDEESRAYIRSQMVERVNEYINASLLNQLNDEQVSEFNDLLDTGTPEQLQGYLSERIPDRVSVVTGALERFINDYGVGAQSDSVQV